MRADPVMQGASKFERESLDAYFTIDTEMCLDALLDAAPFTTDMRLLEPAAGRGHLVQELRRRNYNIEARDIFAHPDPLVDDIAAGHSLRNLESLRGFDFVVTNLPYDTQDELLAHILPIAARDNCGVAILTRASWPIAKRRAKLVHHNKHFDGVVHLPRRPWWSDVRTSSPRHEFAWCVWGQQERATERAAIYFPGE